jgi:DNA repair protein RadA/Sms
MATFTCMKCGATCEVQQRFCVACGTIDSFAPQLKVRKIVTTQSHITPASARSLIGLKRQLSRVHGIGEVPTQEAFITAIYGPAGGGKSTFALAISSDLAERLAYTVLYICAEESPESATFRSKLHRIELTSDDVLCVPLIDPATALSICEDRGAKFVVLDSYSVASWSMSDLLQLKGKGISSLFVVHVTKAEEMAGPAYIRHMADVVLAVEDQRYRHEKNRFGDLSEGDIV